MAGSKEDVETVRAFFQDLRIRGLGDPLLVVSDGASGIARAIEECFPHVRRASVARTPDAQSRSQGLGGSMAGIRNPGHSLLSGALAGRDCAPTGDRHPRRLRQRPAERARLLRR